MKQNLTNWGFLVAAGLLATQALQALGATDNLSGENGAVGAQIEFKTVIADFGTVNAGETVSYDYAFSNTGDQPLILTSVQPGCGCTTATNWTRAVPPGESGSIHVHLDTSHLTGAVSKAIKIESNARNKPLSGLILRGRVFQPFTIEPSGAFLALKPDQGSATSRVKITYNGTNRLSLFDPTVKSPASNRYDASLTTNVPGKEYAISVTVHRSMSIGIDYGSILLQESGADTNALSIPLVTSCSPWLTVSAPQVVLPRNLTSDESASVYVLNNAEFPVSLFDAKADDTNLTVTLTAASSGRSYALKVTAPPGYALERPATVVASTSNTNQPSLSIPVEQR
jgi:hypothetical protein